MPDYTTTGLISRVRRIAALAQNAPGFDNDTALAILNDELQAVVTPWLLRFCGEYMVSWEDVAIDGTTEYFDIPHKAVGSILREVKIVHKLNTGREADDEYTDLNRIIVGQIGTSDADYPCFVLRGDQIQVMNVDQYVGDYLRMYFFRQPNELIPENEAGVIATVAPGSKQVTITTMPTGWGSSNTVDVIQAKPQFRILGEDAAITISGNTLTFADYPTGVAVGDLVSLAGESVIPTIPFQVFPLLAQAAALKILETYPDMEGIAACSAKYKQLDQELSSLFKSRVKGSPVRMVPSRTPFDYV
jgi:hypothetical protein